MIGESVGIDQNDIQRRLDEDEGEFVPSRPIPVIPAQEDKGKAIFYSNKPISDEEYFDRKLNSIRERFNSREHLKTNFFERNESEESVMCKRVAELKTSDDNPMETTKEEAFDEVMSHLFLSLLIDILLS